MQPLDSTSASPDPGNPTWREKSASSGSLAAVGEEGQRLAFIASKRARLARNVLRDSGKGTQGRLKRTGWR